MLVVGPGAVGGVLAAQWAAARVPVRALGRGPRSSLLFTSLEGTTRRVPLKKPDGVAQAAFFCVNAKDLPAAVKAAKRYIGPETVVVGLQNGGRALLKKAFKSVVHGVVLFGANRSRPGEAVHVKGRELLLAPGAGAAAAKALLEKGGWLVTIGRRPR